MEKFYEDIINNIKGFTNEFVYQTFKFGGELNKELLCIYLFGGAHTSILLYDDKHGLNAVGEIRYRADKNNIFISQFECNPELQGNGIGKFMFNLSLAHADSLGAKDVYGYISPTDAIKGFSDKPGVTYNDEKLKLVEIYKKLGCKISPDPTLTQKVQAEPKGTKSKAEKIKQMLESKNAINQMIKFSQHWEKDEKLNALPEDQKQFLLNVVTMQNKLVKKI